MSKLIYLETDEEITDVIDKISKVDEKSVSLVVPRGSTLANSVVNLKLLEKRGKKMGKKIALVTNDKIAKNLASQIGLAVFGSIGDAKAGIEEPEEAPTIQPEADVGTPAESVEEVNGVKVHQYDRDAEEIAGAAEPEILAEEAPESELEVIEAVKDIEAENPEVKEVKGDIEDKDKSDDYKLIKKPFNHNNQSGFSGHHRASDPVFEKIRFVKKRKKLIVGAIIAGAVVALGAVALLILPEATAKISIVSEPFSTTADINVNKEAIAIDQNTLTIPGKYKSLEEELEKPFAATGSKNIGEKAKGKITVYNNWDQQPVSLPAGTKFSGGGAEFSSTAAATIPGAQVGLQGGQFVIIASGTADVNVEATAVGEQANIGPNDFTITTIPKVQQSKIFGKSTAAMSGGTNKVVKVVADKDIASAKESTEKELKDNLVNKIKIELVDKEKLLDSAVSSSVSSESASNKAGDQVDNFNYKVKMKVEVVTFSEDDFKNVLLESAKSKLAENKDIVANKEESTKYDVISSDIAKGTIALKGTFDGYVADKYDVGAIKSDIKGKTIKTATNKITARTGVLSVDISINPNFMRTLPLISRRINVEFNYGSTPLTTGGSGGQQ